MLKNTKMETFSVELQKLPWTHTDLCKAICQRTSMQESEVIGADLLSRLSYYLQRALVRISREAQRLAKSVGKCGKQDSFWMKIILHIKFLYFTIKLEHELVTFTIILRAKFTHSFPYHPPTKVFWLLHVEWKQLLT